MNEQDKQYRLAWGKRVDPGERTRDSPYIRQERPYEYCERHPQVNRRGEMADERNQKLRKIMIQHTGGLHAGKKKGSSHRDGFSRRRDRRNGHPGCAFGKKGIRVSLKENNNTLTL